MSVSKYIKDEIVVKIVCGIYSIAHFEYQKPTVFHLNVTILSCYVACQKHFGAGLTQHITFVNINSFVFC